MLPHWVQSQRTAFIRWCNIHLEPKGYPAIKDIDDFKSGVVLCELMECISGDFVGKYHKNPKYMENYENVNIALEFIKHQGINLASIGATDVVEGNLKLILGLLWMLILHYAVAEISEEGVNAKDGLLLWCQRKTQDYDVEIRDFSSSWTDGLALCALMDHYRPDLLDFDQLRSASPRERVRAALDAASTVGIPALLDVEDILQKPDERSMVAYLAYWFHSFSALDAIETAGRRVAKFHEVWSTALRMRKEYEKRFKALLESMEKKEQEWSTCKLESYDEIKRSHDAIKLYKETTKRSWTTEKTELIQLFGKIRIKLATYGFNTYDPAPELRPEHLNAQWLKLLDAEISFSEKVNEQLGEIRERLRKEFSELANSIAQELHNLNMRISELDGKLEVQLSGILEQSKALRPLETKLGELEKLNNSCTLIGLSDVEYTVYTYAELVYEMNLAKAAVASKLSFVENQMVARKVSNLTPELMDEFESVFRHFDRSRRNALQESEFGAALASLGILHTSDELSELFEKVSEGRSQISFHNFIVYMVSISEDKESLEQVESSFQEISGGKGYVTRSDLEEALLPDEIIDSLTLEMPKKGEGYDFEKYIDSVK